MTRSYSLFCIILFFFFSNPLFSQTEYVVLQESLAKGWNTWSYGSMLNYVLLPEGLSLKINFRNATVGTPYDPDYFLEDITVDKSGRVRPIAHTFDGAYTELVVDGWFGNIIRVQSAASENDIVVLVTPEKNSNTPYHVELQTGMMWNREGFVRRKESMIHATVNNTTHILRSTTNPIETHPAYTSPYLIFSGGSSIGFYSGDEKSIVEVQSTIAAAKQKYEKYAMKYGEKAEAFKATQSVLGWNTLYDAGENRIISPVTRGWNEAWQGYVLFEWDTYFAALLSSLDNKALAYSNAIAITHGSEKGHVGFWQRPGVEASQSQPPVGSMVCWMIYEQHQEKWFLEEVYTELLDWNRWWLKNRVNGGYLTWGAPWEGASVRDIMLESGLDNSPMYEDAKIEYINGNSLFNIADVGLNSLYVADCQYLANIAQALGRTEDEKELRERAKHFSQQVQKLWVEEKGTFLNKYVDTNTFSERLSPTLFYPLLAGIPTKKQAQRVLKEHYFNPEEFYGEYIIPSIAYNDKLFNNNYWRGSIWGPMNFLVYLGLKKYDPAAATELADRSYDLFMKAWNDHHYVFENINSSTGVSNTEDQLNCDPYYHWGALMGYMKFINDKK